jgi:hypothetical protein
LSMAFESQCAMYVGASGAIFGMLGLAVADLVLNWESMVRPVVRAVLLAISIGILLVFE